MSIFNYKQEPGYFRRLTDALKTTKEDLSYKLEQISGSTESPITEDQIDELKSVLIGADIDEDLMGLAALEAEKPESAASLVLGTSSSLALADGSVDTKRLPKAIQSIVSNYRGETVRGIPASELPDVLLKLARAAASQGKMPHQSRRPARTYQRLADVLAQLGRLDEIVDG